MTDRDGSETPDWLFRQAEDQVRELTGHGFQLDAAASDWNAKCPNYYTEEQDSLKQDWARWITIWCNAPFVRWLLALFARKAIEAAERGATVVLLLPSWPGYDWFQELKAKGQSQDIIGPVQFQHHDGGTVVLNNGPRSTALVVITLGPKITPGTIGPAIRRNGIVEPIESAQVRPLPTTSRPSGLCWKPLTDVEPKPTNWHWHRYLPAGELSIVDGNPGSNKSSVLLDIAARVSTGREMPDRSQGIEGGVLLLLGEDSIAKTVRQRLEAANANLGRIVVPDKTVSFPRDLRRIEEVIRETSTKLVIVDPLMAFLTTDASGDQRVRQVLTPLRTIAERTDAAIVLVRHLTKGGSKQAIYRGSGSIGLIGAARSGLLIGRPSDDPDLRVLVQTKSNLGPLAPSLLFEPVDANGVPQIEWRGECDYEAEDLLGASERSEGKLDEAVAFLSELLARGPVQQGEVRQQVVARGLAYRTVERAKELLGAISRREGFGPGSRCYWQLPTEAAETLRP